jgi:hypothetical protein
MATKLKSKPQKKVTTKSKVDNSKVKKSIKTDTKKNLPLKKDLIKSKSSSKNTPSIKKKTSVSKKTEIAKKTVKPTTKKIELTANKKAETKTNKKPIVKDKVKSATIKSTNNSVKQNTIKKSSKITNIKPVYNSKNQVEKKKNSEKTVVANHNYIKYELEFPMHTSRNSLFTFLTDASALSSWFADHVDVINNDEYIFTWDGSKQFAKIAAWKESQMVRYHWLHEPDGTYFEFCIVEDELTFDIALLVTDFAEDIQSLDASKRLWQSQIEDLHHAIGG